MISTIKKTVFKNEFDQKYYINTNFGYGDFLVKNMQKEYQINFSPFVLNADLQSGESNERGFFGHFANSFIPRSGMNRKDVNAKFDYKKKFCINRLTSRILSMPVPGERGIIPVCATKPIKKGQEIIVKYCGGATGYLIKSPINLHAKSERQYDDADDHEEIGKNTNQSAIHNRDERAKRRRLLREEVQL